MLNAAEINSLVARLRKEHLETTAEAAKFCDDSVEHFLDNEQWFLQELRNSGKNIAGDHFSVDLVDAIARCFNIDYETFRRFDIEIAFLLEEEWQRKHASQKDFDELFPLDFETRCELEAEDKIIRKIGIIAFLELRKKEHEEKRRQRRPSKLLGSSASPSGRR